MGILFCFMYWIVQRMIHLSISMLMVTNPYLLTKIEAFPLKLHNIRITTLSYVLINVVSLTLFIGYLYINLILLNTPMSGILSQNTDIGSENLKFLRFYKSHKSS